MITLAAPIERRNSTVIRLRAFSVDVRFRVVNCFLDVGEINEQGSFVAHGERRAEFKDSSQPSFDDFIAGVQGAAQFRRQIEQYLTTLAGLGGSVS